jgi:hypothetical protein
MIADISKTYFSPRLASVSDLESRSVMNDINEYYHQKMNKMHTKNRWQETQAIGQHNGLYGIQLWKHFESQQCQPNNMRGFSDPNNPKFPPRTTSNILEKADPETPNKSAKLRDGKSEHDRPFPGHFLFQRNYCDQIFVFN